MKKYKINEEIQNRIKNAKELEIQKE